MSKRRPMFLATFRPAPHWSSSIRRHDGLRCLWRRVWIVGHGTHAGEWACVPVGAKNGPTWAPESELLERGLTAEDITSGRADMAIY